MNEFISNDSNRLDFILSQELKLSRSKVANFIKNGQIKVNNKEILKPSFKIYENDKISYEIVENEDNEYELKDLEIEILYEDEEIIVVNKPANLVTHGAASVKEATLVDYLKAKNYKLFSSDDPLRDGIVHRLDKGTSGVLVLAKDKITALNLQNQLKTREMGRIYLALTDLPLKEDIILDAPIGRNPKNRLKKCVIEGGRESKSAFVNLIRGEDFDNLGINLISAKLFSGRTHQIRAHLSHLNRQILGDNLYGFKTNFSKIDRLMLHAYLLNLIHPKSGKKMQFVAKLPNQFYEFLQIDKEKIDEKISPIFLDACFKRDFKLVCFK